MSNYTIKMERIFHPVGQGAFYSEHFYDAEGNNIFNTVYDCGTSSSRELVTKCLYATQYNSDYFSNDVDILFISHFDADHVNCIYKLVEKLKKSKKKIKHVVLPLLSKEEQILLMLVYRAQKLQLSLTLLTDPEKIFGNEVKITKVKRMNTDIETEETETIPISDQPEEIESGTSISAVYIPEYKINLWKYVTFNCQTDIQSFHNYLNNIIKQGKIYQELRKKILETGIAADEKIKSIKEILEINTGKLETIGILSKINVILEKSQEVEEKIEAITVILETEAEIKRFEAASKILDTADEILKEASLKTTESVNKITEAASSKIAEEFLKGKDNIENIKKLYKESKIDLNKNSMLLYSNIDFNKNRKPDSLLDNIAILSSFELLGNNWHDKKYSYLYCQICLMCGQDLQKKPIEWKLRENTKERTVHFCYVVDNKKEYFVPLVRSANIHYTTACLYTGDSVLKTITEELNKHPYASLDTVKIGTIQIAHHGAKDNHDIDFYNKLACRGTVCPVSYGTKNCHGHPRREVISTLEANNYFPIHITEREGFIQKFTITLQLKQV